MLRGQDMRERPQIFILFENSLENTYLNQNKQKNACQIFLPT